jgi:hypothetical protein
MIVSSDLDTFPLWYLRHVEGFRDDVAVVNRILMRHGWYRTSLGLPAGLPEGQEEAALSLRAMIESGSRTWYCPPDRFDGIPGNLTPVPFHLTVRLSSGQGRSLPARGYTWRGFFERARHLPEPHSQLAVGYTLEVFRNLAAIDARFGVH